MADICGPLTLHEACSEYFVHISSLKSLNDRSDAMPRKKLRKKDKSRKIKPYARKENNHSILFDWAVNIVYWDVMM